MRAANLANEAVRQADVGQVWEEVLSGGAATLNLRPYSTFRVRAAAAVTVTIDGTLAMTMISGEIAVFNAGSGQPGISGPTPADTRAIVAVVAITGTAFVQVGRDNVRKA